MIITISGLHGTGKSTIAKKLAEKLDYDYYSTGQAFRDLAKEKGLSLEEFSDYVENHPEVDKELDEKVMELAKRDDIIIDSQLGGHLLEDIADFKILLTASLETRVKRMAERDNTPIEEKLEETEVREESEYHRFKELYGFDLRDEKRKKSLYNLIISTQDLSISEVVNEVLSHLNSKTT